MKKSFFRSHLAAVDLMLKTGGGAQLRLLREGDLSMTAFFVYFTPPPSGCI